jgi:catechol 2,3-dioxygenase-like lactoylglutathione lyase family enzyme
MSAAPHVSPRVRAYGKARIDITRRARDEDEWRKLWRGPSSPYPFKAGAGWKFNVCYTVDDYAAEIGFLIDVLGFPVESFSPSQAQITNPERDFAVTILSASEDWASTPAEALRLQLNVIDLFQIVQELERRGVTFDQQPVLAEAGIPSPFASFRTPHGIVIELLGEEKNNNAPLEHGHDVENGSTADPKSEELPFAEEPEDNLRISADLEAGKSGNENIELTYDALDEGDAPGEDIEIEEEFP